MLSKTHYALIGTALAATLATAGCDKAAIDTNDSTPPTAVIKVKGADGQYAPQTTAQLGFDGLEIMCVAEDPQGVQQVSVTYAGTTSNCQTGVVANAGAFAVDGLPPNPAPQPLTGGADGKTPTSVPILATISPALTCQVPGPPPQQGRPNGGTATVTCSANNWATQNNDATSTLTITLPFIPTPPS